MLLPAHPVVFAMIVRQRLVEALLAIVWVS